MLVPNFRHLVAVYTHKKEQPRKTFAVQNVSFCITGKSKQLYEQNSLIQEKVI